MFENTGFSNETEDTWYNKSMTFIDFYSKLQNSWTFQGPWRFLAKFIDNQGNQGCGGTLKTAQTKTPDNPVKYIASNFRKITL